MKPVKKIVFGITCFIMTVATGCVSTIKDSAQQIWYEQPANEWMEAIPLGNGRLGAMIYGGIESETIALNESSMWSGEYDPDQEKAFGKQKLNDLRKLFFEGKLSEGNQIASQHLTGNWRSFGTHLPIGDLKLDFTYPEGKVTNYRRSLNLENAISEVSFNINGINYTREYFCSNPDDVIIFRLSADSPGKIALDLSLDMLRESDIVADGNNLSFSGKVSFDKHGVGGVNFIGTIKISTDGGEMVNSDGKLTVSNANSLTAVIDVRTDYKNENYKQLCENTLQAAFKREYNTMRADHMADFSSLFNRVTIDLGKSEYEHLPTDKRWKQLKESKTDVGLDALFFQYGRYLLISASRKNSPLPAALQGFWNDNLACNMGWTNDYHLDINTEQNYWIANVGNLHECHTPLFNYIKDLSIHGEKTARKVYGCNGWTAHTVANVWGFTAPSQSIWWGVFPTASSWIASHLWTQYLYTQDKDYLSEVAYPLLKGNARFLLDYMTIDPNSGYLVTGPSISPENSFKYKGEQFPTSMMPACDRQLAFEIFTSCLESTKILDVDKSFADSLETALSKLSPIMIGKNGAIQEWFEDYEEAVPNHRHTSHLLAFYPFAQITLDKTPELAIAVRKTIENRLAAEGWEDTEWSRANMVCFYARLKDQVEAYKSLVMLQRDFSRENMMTVSPAGIAGAPYDIFCLDGNTAGAAGIAEMLLQTHEGYLELLPCLPVEWKDGSFSGLCIPGGGEVSAEWKDSQIKRMSLKATVPYTFCIKMPEGKQYRVALNKEVITVNQDDTEVVKITMKAGDVVTME